MAVDKIGFRGGTNVFVCTPLKKHEIHVFCKINKHGLHEG